MHKYEIRHEYLYIVLHNIKTNALHEFKRLHHANLVGDKIF